MRIDLVHEALNGLKVFQPEVFEDERGFFCEVYRKDHYTAAGVTEEFVQDNHSKSAHGVVRGLHFQWEPPMAKLMRVTQGEAFLVAVDIRLGSPSFGQWYGELVSDKNRRLIYAPAGFARGFCVTSESAEIQYKCTGIYNSGAEAGILWNDPAIGIQWPVLDPTLSNKDKVAPTLADWEKDPRAQNFKF